MARIDTYFKKLHDIGGSDLHLASNVVPKMRLHGKLTPLKEGPMSPDRMAELFDEIFNERQRRIFNETNDLDMAYEIPGMARFRVSIFQTLNGPAGVFRIIPEEILPLKKLGVPMSILRYTALRSGLILVTGPTGSGKSTTLASLIDYINVNQKRHIITIEEPIEFVHPNKNCYISQREVGVDQLPLSAAVVLLCRPVGAAVLVLVERLLPGLVQAVATEVLDQVQDRGVGEAKARQHRLRLARLDALGRDVVEVPGGDEGQDQAGVVDALAPRAPRHLHVVARA